MIRCDWCKGMDEWVVNCLCRRVVWRACAETHGCGSLKRLGDLARELGFGLPGDQSEVEEVKP